MFAPAVNPVERAMRNYLDSGTHDQPNSFSGVIKHRGKDYVVLRNQRGTLAVYLITNSNRLRKLDAWPRALDNY